MVEAKDRARAVAAVRFKSWWTSVWLTQGAIAFPTRCACCGSNSALRQKTITLARDDKLPIGYPICEPCLRHGRTDEAIIGVAAVSGVVLSVAAWIAIFGTAVLRRPSLMWVAALVVYVAMVSAVYYPLKWLFVRTTPRCQGPEWPIEAEPRPSQEGSKSERADDRMLRELSLKINATSAPVIALRVRARAFADDILLKHGADPKMTPQIEEKA